MTIEHSITAPDGTTLVHRVAGAGPCVVIVHGMLADAAQWDDVAAGLAERGHRVVVPHRRGRAPSGPLGEGYTLKTEVADLHGLLDALGPGVRLVGHSYGGVIALLAALERRDLEALVLYEPPISTRPFGGAALAAVQSAVARGDRDAAMEILVTEISPTPPEVLAGYRGSAMWQSQLRFVASAAAEVAAVDAYVPDFRAYGALTVPTTVLLGAASEGKEPFGPAAVALAEALLHARLVRLPNQGHLAHTEAPRELAGVIASAVR